MKRNSEPLSPLEPRILIAAFGNILRGDDGFGPAVLNSLGAGEDLPAGTRCVELGIGGVGLVHELMAGFEGLILLDAIDRGSPPGTLHVLEVSALHAADLSPAAVWQLAGDMHRGVPSQALIMAQAAGVLPRRVYLIGCQPAETEELMIALTPAVHQSVALAADQVRGLVRLLAAELTQTAG